MTLVPTCAQQKTQLAPSKLLGLCTSKVRRITVLVVTAGQFHAAFGFGSRITEQLGLGRDLTDHPIPHPCHGQGPIPPAQGAPSPVQAGLEPCQGGVQPQLLWTPGASVPPTSE